MKNKLCINIQGQSLARNCSINANYFYNYQVSELKMWVLDLGIKQMVFHLLENLWVTPKPPTEINRDQVQIRIKHPRRSCQGFLPVCVSQMDWGLNEALRGSLSLEESHRASLSYDTCIIIIALYGDHCIKSPAPIFCLCQVRFFITQEDTAIYAFFRREFPFWFPTVSEHNPSVPRYHSFLILKKWTSLRGCLQHLVPSCHIFMTFE